MSDKTMPLPILAWENNLAYWRQLHAVIDAETVLEAFRPMLGMLAQLGIAKGKPFRNGRALRTLEGHAEGVT